MGRVPDGIGGIGIGVKKAAVEEMFLDVVRITKAEFGVITERIVDLRGTARGIGASDIVIDVLENMLGVPNDEFETFTRRALANDVPVVLRPIIISNPMIDDHVVNEIVEVDVLLEQFVLSVAGEVGAGEREDRVPGIEIPGYDLRAEISSVFDDVIVGFVAAEIAGGKIFVRPLMDVMEAPVKAVEVNVIELAMERGMPHGDHKIARVLVADV